MSDEVSRFPVISSSNEPQLTGQARYENSAESGSGAMPAESITATEKSADATQLYLKEIGYAPLLTAEEEVRFARLSRQGDASSRRRMIVCNLRLVVKIARRYGHRGMSLLDLIEEGNLGLMHAVEKFDPERGFRFSTYATWWIRQNIERGLMNQARTIRLPVHILKELSGIRRKAQEFRKQAARDPSIEELAGISQKTVAEVKRLLAQSEGTTSADSALLAGSDMCLLDTFISEMGKQPEYVFQHSQLRNRMDRWLQQLPEKQQDIIARRFGMNGHSSDTLENVGSEVGLTRERVRQIQIEALKALKTIIRRDGVAEDIFTEF